ncbi:Ribosomal protein L11 methyltransferase [Zhongshania aliphaticivorans]|uniref:Ribosomal protein L11 methyltransferase n=1 Tax=Zhongshania aliphaticivorans TaxID=1470434 RepID=A0A5S9Q418_9GAMM|nr:50S ribosomal protein L11 methyltransferase [Zhongshania aliphaticivorans]CAA0093952.1 Ribosomal protein L11 methyltransferase [Zhongshania aliphaticivorans]CAA0112034.1 Ribosomal protein L11 methyltransferase [Zhongshania aliphaticivorans]
MQQALSSVDLEQSLGGLLQEILPAAKVVKTALPLVPEMSLYLLSEDFPQHDLSPEQTQRIMNYPAYWCFCWASGQVMARYIFDHPELLRGKRVLDFGCGSGVAAIAAKMAGALEVIACDLDVDAIKSSRANAVLNKVELTYCDDFFANDDCYDVILVADVLYDRANLPLLDAFLARAPKVLVADSRVKDFCVEGYQWLDFQQATTVPDLAESEEFSRVNLYLGAS